MDGLYFDGSPEPDDFMFDFHDAVQMVAKSKGATFITIDFENKEDYYKALNEMRQFTEENVSIVTTSKESDHMIIIEPELNLDDRNNK
jgi:hypothetical protein